MPAVSWPNAATGRPGLGKQTLRNLDGELGLVRGGLEGDGSIFETIVGKPRRYTESPTCTAFCATTK